MAEVKLKWTTLWAFLRTVRFEVSIQLATEDMVRIGCNKDLRFWRMHRNTILALLAIVWLAEVDRNETGAEWILYEYVHVNFIFLFPVPLVTRRRDDRTEVTEACPNEIRRFHLEEYVEVACVVFSLSGLSIGTLKMVEITRSSQCWVRRTG